MVNPGYLKSAIAVGDILLYIILPEKETGSLHVQRTAKPWKKKKKKKKKKKNMKTKNFDCKKKYIRPEDGNCNVCRNVE
jgi:hypothetical protein